MQVQTQATGFQTCFLKLQGHNGLHILANGKRINLAIGDPQREIHKKRANLANRQTDDIVPSLLLTSNLEKWYTYGRSVVRRQGSSGTLMVSPWLKASSAPAGSSVKAHGLTTANGTPLCLTSSSPCRYTSLSNLNKLSFSLKAHGLTTAKGTPLCLTFCVWELETC